MNRNCIFLFVVVLLSSCTKTVVSTQNVNLNKSNDSLLTNKVINPLDTFTGYKVDSNAKQLGTDYWENSSLPSDLIVAVFQKNYENQLNLNDHPYEPQLKESYL